MERLTASLAGRWPVEETGEGLRRAAVVALLIDIGGEAGLLLTQRSAEVGEYVGHIALPGGRVQPDDADALAAALRECREEIGLDVPRAAVLGRLDDARTNLGHVVTPFVAAWSGSRSYLPDRREVARVIEAPIASLLAPGVRGESLYFIGDRIRPTYAYRLPDAVVWGLTGRITQQLLSILEA